MYASGQKNRHIDKLVKTLRLPGYLEIELINSRMMALIYF